MPPRTRFQTAAQKKEEKQITQRSEETKNINSPTLQEAWNLLKSMLLKEKLLWDCMDHALLFIQGSWHYTTKRPDFSYDVLQWFEDGQGSSDSQCGTLTRG